MHVTRSRLVTLLGTEADIEAIGRLDFDGDTASAAARLSPHVMIINTDYMMSQVLPVAAEVRARAPQCGIIVVVDPSKPGMLPPRRRPHALSFVAKDAPGAFLVETVRRSAGGEEVVDPRLDIASLAVEKPMNTRELVILGLAAKGTPVAEIANQLCLSRGT